MSTNTISCFNNYTGNAMLNNALMTIEALGNLSNVSEITPETLLKLYKTKNVKELNKRLKSYTMLFSLNNPLVNPAKKQDLAGERTYDNLLIAILNNFENTGSKVCEISGLRFDKTFESFYQDEIENQKKLLKLKKLDPKEEKKQLGNLDNTDFSLNRSWFPLIGGLGSDAQALPQAKYTLQIHPICIPIMQFLPLASLLYNRGILLVDSSNFDFAKRYIKGNVKEVEKRIQGVSVNSSIENIRDFSKGNYLLKAIELLQEKETFEEEYSDLNLWSFSNSGTGASCSIDRVPNSLIKKLQRLKTNPKTSIELTSILNNNNSAYHFLEALESNQEWYGLYPNVYGTGKKKVEVEGVSIDFFEAYFKEVNSSKKLVHAKYLAYLINKYKTESFAKYLDKKDAWHEPEFKNDLYTVLVKATEQGEWSLEHHLAILDNDQIPVRNNFYYILKATHFYYYKSVFDSTPPPLIDDENSVKNLCYWIIALIQHDHKKDIIIKDLLSPQNYASVNYLHLFYRASQKSETNLGNALYAFYDENYQSIRFGLNGLLRIFFSQPKQEELSLQDLVKSQQRSISNFVQKWILDIENFTQNYQNYYFDKYENKLTGNKPYEKFLNLIHHIPNENPKFLIWFYEALENVNQFLTVAKWSDSLLYEPNGEYQLSFAKFAIKFSLHKQLLQVNNNQLV